MMEWQQLSGNTTVYEIELYNFFIMGNRVGSPILRISAEMLSLPGALLYFILLSAECTSKSGMVGIVSRQGYFILGAEDR